MVPPRDEGPVLVPVRGPKVLGGTSFDESDSDARGLQTSRVSSPTVSGTNETLGRGRCRHRGSPIQVSTPPLYQSQVSGGKGPRRHELGEDEHRPGGDPCEGTIW